MLITQKGRWEYTSSKAGRRIVVESNADLWYKTRRVMSGVQEIPRFSCKQLVSGGLGESQQKLRREPKQ